MCGLDKMIPKVLQKPQALRLLLLPHPTPHPTHTSLLPFPLQALLEMGVTTQIGLRIRLDDIDGATFPAEQGLQAVNAHLGGEWTWQQLSFPALSHTAKAESWPNGCFLHFSVLSSCLCTAEPKSLCSLGYFRHWIVKHLRFALQSLPPLPLSVVLVPYCW